MSDLISSDKDEFLRRIPKENATPTWNCKARATNMGANDPQDCNWPMCGCDPYADKVIEALQESGLLCTQRDRERAILEARIEEAEEWYGELIFPYLGSADARDIAWAKERLADWKRKLADLARLGDAPGNAK